MYIEISSTDCQYVSNDDLCGISGFFRKLEVDWQFFFLIKKSFPLFHVQPKFELICERLDKYLLLYVQIKNLAAGGISYLLTYFQFTYNITFVIYDIYCTSFKKIILYIFVAEVVKIINIDVNRTRCTSCNYETMYTQKNIYRKKKSILHSISNENFFYNYII